MLLEKRARSLLKSFVAARNRRRRNSLCIRTGIEASLRPTVYFLTPDFDEPSGGVRVIYRHADILNSTGINACVLHQRRGFRCTWFHNQTRFASVADVKVLRGDILVVPELLVETLGRISSDVNYVIFNQGVHLSWDGTSHSVAKYYARGHGLLGVITVSEHSRTMLRYAFPAADIRRIHVGIDAALFHSDDRPRANRIAYMPRRMSEDAHQVLELARGRGLLEGWEVVEIKDLTQAEVAAQLRTTKMFLAFTYQEGFGLPPAEAMASGNYVIGYHGFGGRELFREEFSAPVDTGDVVGYVKAIEHAVKRERFDAGWCQRKGAISSEFIATNYSLGRERQEVVRHYSEFLADAHALSSRETEYEQNI